MRNKIFAIIALAGCMAVSAQETCVINGRIGDCQLADGKKVKKVYLVRTDEFGQERTVATAKVKKGQYTFEFELSQGAPALLYAIKGFGDSKGIELFVEPGNVTVTTASAAEPEQSTVAGTPTNDTYTEYKGIRNNDTAETNEQAAVLGQLKEMSQTIRFLIEHNASPMTPLVAERDVLPLLSATYAGQMKNAIAASLHEHPYYHSLCNRVLAADRKVGNELPNVTLPLLSGDTKHLKDYRGKYVILNFWKRDCEASAAMIAEMQRLHELVEANPEQLLIISFALDTDAAAWKAAVADLGIDREGWLHASDAMGTASPAARLLGVADAPKILLVEPEGIAVSLDMEVDEVVSRIEQILSGDLYYLDLKE